MFHDIKCYNYKMFASISRKKSQNKLCTKALENYSHVSYSVFKVEESLHKDVKRWGYSESPAAILGHRLFGNLSCNFVAPLQNKMH